MRVRKISSTYFSDGDSFIFVDVQEEWRRRRDAHDCEAVVNVEAQGSSTHWVAAGEASLWSFAAIDDFSSFVFLMYEKHMRELELKFLRKSCVVDMSLLWLWWVAHHRSSTGRPFKAPYRTSPGRKSSIQNIQARCLRALTFFALLFPNFHSRSKYISCSFFFFFF